MAENLIINGVTYNDVESVAIANEENETVQYYSDAIRYSEQSLTDEQKVQTRTNIDVYSKDEIDTKVSTLNTSISGKAPAYTYSTTDLTAGTSALETSKLYFVYK